MNILLAILAPLSLALTLWQWLAARWFPLHERAREKTFVPPVTLLKPLKGCDAKTEECLRSWFAQDYPGRVQIFFGVDDADDPACEVVNRLLCERPQPDARLIICPKSSGANPKVAKLAHLAELAENEILVISDADVHAPPDFLAHVVQPLRDEKVGLVNSFYRLAKPITPAMRWEAVAVNADFWSMVLQARTLSPLDFALGAAMVTRRKQLAEIGGFAAIADCLADDYQLGQRIARRGYRIELSPLVVDCRAAAMGWRAVWRHQLRWARTIRVSRPVSYFFTITHNPTLWPLLWLLWCRDAFTLGFFLLTLLVRIMTALHLRWKLTDSAEGDADWWLVPVKDVLQAAIWLRSFTGSRVEWRGERFRLRRDGTLQKIG